jgi:hypothetical protein
MSKRRLLRICILGFVALLAGAGMAMVGLAQDPAQGPPKGPMQGPPKESPPTEVDAVLKGFEKVVSTPDGKPSMYTVYINRKDSQLLVELPKDFATKKYFIALTVASGELYAGLQAGDLYVYWKQYGNRLALVEPDLNTRSTGDAESKSSVNRLFTGNVIADVPILATPPNRGPIINLNELLLAHAPKFFGVRGGLDPKAQRLREIKTAKAFPQNIEIAYELPLPPEGKLKTLHFSISEIPDNTGYSPRVADERVGYFTTAFTDLGKYKRGETKTRYINRWHLEKADPTLKMSPPKQPIVFYIEHTTPIRYRRFIRDGVLYWNQAFEKVGIVNAVEAHFQDARSGAHMEKDPEDVRYNFVRWLNNNIGTAIGPSRVHPLTGQILDADIILTDGWIRHFENQFTEVLPQIAMEGFGPETLAWLDQNPQWDPRLLLVPMHKRQEIQAERARRGVQPLGGHTAGEATGRLMGTNEFDGLVGRVSQVNGMCLAAAGKALDLTLLRMTQEFIEQEAQKDDKDAPPAKGDDDDQLDGVPSRFIGPLLADLVAHEVGHTLGLRHNFKASSLYSLADINSNKLKGKKALAGSVMDYLPVNINMKDGEVQGDFTMITVGPYDVWAIEYGYTFAKDLKPILARCTEPEHQYATDQDTMGPDPLARRYDFSADPLDFAKSQMKLAKHHRERLLSKFVADGESWSKARRGYELTLMLQTRSLSMMSNWIGGAFVRRDHKGDKGNRLPLEAVSAAQQREALKWVVANAFQDDAFGLNSQFLQRFRGDGLVSDESFSRVDEATFPVHDRIIGIQSSVLTMLMNPSTLRRIYDNEVLVEADKDAVTLPEVLDMLQTAIWTEVDKTPGGKFSARKPMISSLRRNLQREYIDRLIDVAHPTAGNSPASKTLATLARMYLRQANAKIEKTLKTEPDALDPYTKAHLQDANNRITKALDASFTINPRDQGLRTSILMFGDTTTRGGAITCNHADCSCRGPGWNSRTEKASD